VYAEISLSQLDQNIEVVKQQLKEGIKILFVVKLDAYGHGIANVSKLVEKTGLDYLGVTNVLEARIIRSKKVKLPILLLNLAPVKYAKEIVELGIAPTIANHDMKFIWALNKESQLYDTITPIHIKVDTGLGRLGVFPSEVIPLLKKLQNFRYLRVEGIYSHFSAAESGKSADIKYTVNQIAIFRQLLKALKDEDMLPPIRHIANSSGFIQYQDQVTEPPLNMVRLGTLLYGYPEVQRLWTNKIKPIMSLFTEISDIRQLPPNTYVSYGRTYKTTSTKKIAVLPVGYGYGLNRRLSNVGKVYVRGQRAPIIGEICANHTMVDVSGINGVKVGDRVELMGKNLLASELGKEIGAGILEMLAPFAETKIKRVYNSIHGEMQ